MVLGLNYAILEGMSSRECFEVAFRPFWKKTNSLKDVTESCEANETQKLDKVHPICHTVVVHAC